MSHGQIGATKAAHPDTLRNVTIDLHTHTAVSDGTDTPSELMHKAAQAGLSVIGITDHDTSDGWAEAASAVGQTGVGLVRGVEISTTCRGISVHLLSYLHDPAHLELEAALAASRASRDTRARLMVDKLGQDYPVTWSDVQAQAAPGATVGRPHIADALVQRGVVKNRSEAFDHILAPRGPYYVRYETPDLAEAIRLVRDAGGVPVLAHVRASARGRIITDQDIASLVEHGLAGIEVDHRDHTPADRDHLRALAADLGLFATGSSDYHGSGKPNQLGEHTTPAHVLDCIAAQGFMDVIYP